MSNYYIIGAGGTGAMCVRSFLCTLAAMEANANTSQDTYYIRLVDMDERSDAIQKCVDMVEHYKNIRKQGTLFPIVVLERWDFPQAVKAVAQANGITFNNETITLRKLFGSQPDATTKLLLNTLFSDEEMDKPLEGFYGHPNIGSVVFYYAQNLFLQNEGEFMGHLYQDLKKTQAVEKPIPLYLYGSLFGGTGASVIPNIVSVLRSMTDGQGNSIGERLKIGICMLMPYYKLPAPPSNEQRNVAPNDAKFFKQTQEALRFYKDFGLTDGTKAFNLLLLGVPDSVRSTTAECYAEEGTQYQHFHIVHFVSAVAGYHFVKQTLDHPMTMETGTLLWGISPQTVDGNGFERMNLTEIGLISEKAKAETMFRFSFMVSQFMVDRYNEIKELAGKREYAEVVNTWGDIKRPVFRKTYANISPDQWSNQYFKPLGESADFCKDYINFFFDIALTGYDWTQFHSKDPEGRPSIGCRADNYRNFFGNRWMNMINLAKADQCAHGNSMAGLAIGQFDLKEFFSFECSDDKRLHEADFNGGLATNLLKVEKDDNRSIMDNILTSLYLASKQGREK